jgi:hypothetical protein
MRTEKKKLLVNYIERNKTLLFCSGLYQRLQKSAGKGEVLKSTVKNQTRRMEFKIPPKSGTKIKIQF